MFKLSCKGSENVDTQTVKKIATAVNSVILLLVFGLMAFFAVIKVSFLVWFSIPTALVYIVGFVLIRKEMLDVYLRLVYFWLTLYMCTTTVCLGYGYGFHLYCFSMIPVIFVTEYMSFRLGRKGVSAVFLSIIIAVLYLVCTGYVSYYGPVYERSEKAASFFWLFNALCVFGFLIYYTAYLIRSIIKSEQKLTELAHSDQLTGLYNRHFMQSRLEESGGAEQSVIAMADIDDFKKINDTYGHNAGDEVLRTVADIMRNVCTGCDIARWGGEEFHILLPKSIGNAQQMLEQLRKSISEHIFTFGGTDVRVTLTIGAAAAQTELSADELIRIADDKLYSGKRSGKNKLVL